MLIITKKLKLIIILIVISLLTYLLYIINYSIYTNNRLFGLIGINSGNHLDLEFLNIYNSVKGEGEETEEDPSFSIINGKKIALNLAKFPSIIPEIEYLISSKTNKKVYDYINTKDENGYYSDFSQLALELRELQSFWIISRRLVIEGIENSSGDEGIDNFTNIEVKHYLLNLFKSNSKLSNYLKKLEKFYSLMSKLEDKLVSWIKPYNSDILTLHDSFQTNSKAIVIGISNDYMSLGSTTIRSIRELHNCSIPIHIYYIGDSDLNSKNQQILVNLSKKIFIHDITKLIDNKLLKLNGWALKPFSALLAPAEEILLMDADVTFLQSPDLLFKNTNYLNKKALFFRDRALWRNSPKKANWVSSFIMGDEEFNNLHSKSGPKLNTVENNKANYKLTIPERLKDSRYLTLKTNHEQESGVLLINKRERLLPLLATCSMNNYFEREEITYKKFYGDKETFWSGFEMLGGEYSWNQNTPGMIGDGYIKPQTDLPDLPTISRNFNNKGSQRICSSQMLHFDNNNEPFWFNEGLYANKFRKEWGLVNLTHYLKSNSDVSWTLGENHWVCMRSRDDEVTELSSNIIKLIESSKKILIELREKYGFDS